MAAVAEVPPHSNLVGTPLVDALFRMTKLVQGIVLCTVGQNGIMKAGKHQKAGYVMNPIPAYPVSGPIDICGAGDSCSAGIACAMVSGLTHEQAAAFGNLVASITIQQIGVTGTATPEQVRTRWREVQPRT